MGSQKKKEIEAKKYKNMSSSIKIYKFSRKPAEKK